MCFFLLHASEKTLRFGVEFMNRKRIKKKSYAEKKKQKFGNS